MYIRFNSSADNTIGVELEVQTVSPRTGELVNGAGFILTQLEGEVLFKPELFNSTLEVNTPVCTSLTDLDTTLQTNLKTINYIAEQNDLRILISGCHPFSNWQQQQITQKERYLNLLKRIQWPVRQFLIFGLHVHVGVNDPDKVIYLMNRFTQYLPHLIALSASSPFFNGIDTGLAASRIKIFEELPNAGIPYYFEDWENYSTVVNRLIQTNSIDTVRDVWWDIRPHPIFGTLEIRVCDAMPTLKENLALTSFIYLLAVKFRKEFEENRIINHAKRWILEENKWRAARYGIQGEIILNEEGEIGSLKQEIKSVYDELMKLADQPEWNHTKKYMSVIPEIMKVGPSYLRQRQWARKQPGDYKSIVNNLLVENRENRMLNGQ